MMNQHTANLIVELLLLLSPVLAFWLVQLRHDLQTLLVRIVTQSILEHRLIEIETLYCESFGVRVFFEEFSCDKSTL